jgi:mannose-6-phosphate isomerase-like protein (cupin superfamily)
MGQHEWVVVLKGAAKVHFEGDELPVEMRLGDFVNIPAHQIWLAIYYKGNP